MTEKIHHNLIDTFKQHKLELACIGISSICYNLYNFWKKSQITSNRSDKVQARLKRRRSLLAPSNRYIDTETMKLKYEQHNDYKPSKEILNSQNSLLDEVQFLNNPICKIVNVPHLIKQLQLKNIPNIRSPLIGKNQHINIFGGQGFLPEQAFVYKGSHVIEKNYFGNTKQLIQSKNWLLAGPRKFLHFKPENVKACIVTCGGLCPGLNVVIRQIFVTLTITYGCPEVWGVDFGYKGFYSGEKNWRRLRIQDVRQLQYQGGTVLGSSRGGFDAQKIVDAVVAKGINQMYVIGGDGTHRGISVLCEQIRKRKLQISIVGIPKTIDNDVPIIDKSFGFQTAVSESIRAIRSAYVESTGVDYGMGLVKLMGRDAGFIAMEATNTSRDVDVCLIPQFQFDLYGKYGVLEYIYQQLKIKKHLVIVVAEGAGYGVRDLKELAQGAVKDESNNIKLPDIGTFLKVQIVKYCDKRAKQQKTKYQEDLAAFQKKQVKEKPIDPQTFEKATLKYIDPAYMIRTVPANSYDRKVCAHLASSAVHGAIAGFTNFTVGHINGTPAMIPISALGKPNRVGKSNRAWQRLLALTEQPSFQNDD